MHTPPLAHSVEPCSHTVKTPGQCGQCKFTTPEKIVADGHGNLYGLDSGNMGFGIPGHITKLLPSSTPLAKWGTERFVWNPRSLTVD